jgi:hypothetical protein
VDSFTGALPINYLHHEHIGHRVATLRNLGARHATAPVLIFLDTGTLIGKAFLRHHLDAHQSAAGPLAVTGYVYGYNPENPSPDIGEAIRRYPPDEFVAKFSDREDFRDIRSPEFSACDFDLSRLVAPWKSYWSLNCSVAAAEFHAVGGFDDHFHRWGMEDVELGYRLHKHGVSFQLSMDAWGIEVPHYRNPQNWPDVRFNTGYFLQKHGDPILEFGWAYMNRYRERFWDWDEELRRLAAWTRQVRDLAVADEIAQAAMRLPVDSRIAVLGAGAAVPDSLPQLSVLLDFDETLLARALAGGQHQGHHTLGIRTPLADRSVDGVIVTSRMAGLFPRWRNDILVEAHRIGTTVTVDPSCLAEPAAEH